MSSNNLNSRSRAPSTFGSSPSHRQVLRQQRFSNIQYSLIFLHRFLLLVFEIEVPFDVGVWVGLPARDLRSFLALVSS